MLLHKYFLPSIIPQFENKNLFINDKLVGKLDPEHVFSRILTILLSRKLLWGALNLRGTP